MRRLQRFLLAGSLLLLLASGEAAKAAQMYEGPISADFRDLALNAVAKSNDADAVNKGLDDLVKYSNTPDENSQALSAVEALLGDVDANSYLFSQASLTKAKFLKRLGRGGEAIALFNDGIARHWKNALLRYSESLIESGELADACALEYRRVVAEEPYAFYRGEQEDLIVFLTQLRLLKSDKPYEKAMDSVYAKLPASTFYPHAQTIAEILCLMVDERFDEAIERIQKADAELAQNRNASYDEYRNMPLYLASARLGKGDLQAAGDDYAEFLRRNYGEWEYIRSHSMRTVHDMELNVQRDLPKAQVILNQLLASEMITDEKVRAQFSDDKISGIYDMLQQSLAWGGDLDKSAEICKFAMDNYYPQTLAGANCAMNWARYISWHDKNFTGAEQILLGILNDAPFPEIRPWANFSLAEIAKLRYQPYIALNYLSEVLNLIPESAKGGTVRCREDALQLKNEILASLSE
ncbi:MAG: hypothetical protein AB1656_22820 [Candidatus Omnitrophota bacterium]